MLLLQLRLNC